MGEWCIAKQQKQLFKCNGAKDKNHICQAKYMTFQKENNNNKSKKIVKLKERAKLSRIEIGNKCLRCVAA